MPFWWPPCPPLPILAGRGVEGLSTSQSEPLFRTLGHQFRPPGHLIHRGTRGPVATDGTCCLKLLYNYVRLYWRTRKVIRSLNVYCTNMYDICTSGVDWTETVKKEYLELLIFSNYYTSMYDNHGKGYRLLKTITWTCMKTTLKVRVPRQSVETSICGHTEPFLRKNEATTRFLGKFWV